MFRQIKDSDIKYLALAIKSALDSAIQDLNDGEEHMCLLTLQQLQAFMKKISNESPVNPKKLN